MSKVSLRTVAADLPGHEATYWSEPKNAVVLSTKLSKKLIFINCLVFLPPKHNKSSHTPDITLVKKSGGNKNT